jgi:hypothetical protein
MGIKERLQAITAGMSARGDTGGGDGPLVALVSDLRQTTEFQTLAAEADAADYDSIAVMVGCAVQAGYVEGALGAAIAHGLAFSVTGKELAMVHELTEIHSGLALTGSCDLSVGYFRPRPGELKGGGYAIGADVHVVPGVGIEASWDLEWSGLASPCNVCLVPDPCCCGTGMGSRLCMMWEHRDEVDFSGIAVSAGVGVGISTFSGQGSDAWVKVLTSPDPMVRLSVVDFDNDEVEVRNVGDPQANIQDYVIQLGDGRTIPLASGELFGYHAANGNPIYSSWGDRTTNSVAFSDAHGQTVCWDGHEPETYELCRSDSLRVSAKNLKSTGRVSLYKTSDLSQESLVDEAAWGSGSCSEGAKANWQNCGVCSLGEGDAHEIFTQIFVGETWGTGSSEWRVRKSSERRKWGHTGSGDYKACSPLFFAGASPD